jgi:putative transposase
METLNIKGMLKNSRLSWSIQEKSWHMFTRILEQKAYEHGRKLIHIDQWYPSSKICNNCRYYKEDLTLSNRTWTCPHCGNRHDRDINAAKNIHQEGLKKPIKYNSKHTFIYMNRGFPGDRLYHLLCCVGGN